MGIRSMCPSELLEPCARSDDGNPVINPTQQKQPWALTAAREGLVSKSAEAVQILPSHTEGGPLSLSRAQ